MPLFKKYPILSRFLLIIVFPAFALTLYGLFYLYKSVPNYNASVVVSGLQNGVTIRRDEYGIPSIEGKNDHDVFFAMGYVQAQDRLWQMETQRRLVQGRLSEIFGAETVDRDIWMRTLGLYLAAQKSWPNLDGPAQDALQAYADGVNAWINQSSTLPIEFKVFKIAPDKWTPIDSLALGKLFALTLGSNSEEEIKRQIAVQILPRKYFDSLYPHTLDDVNTLAIGSLSSLYDIQAINEKLKESNFIGGKNVGSNAWVVSGKLTRSGSPILANDPHLALQIPSFWYATTLNGSEIHSSGMTLVGFPIIIFGKNQHIAWGGTSLMADVQDLVGEEVSEENPNFYRYQGTWKKFSEREEIIKVGSEFPEVLRTPVKPITIKVRSTENGPVVSDIRGNASHVMSLHWTALDDHDTTFEALYKLNFATDWSSFRHALSMCVAPALNFLYADQENNIGYSAAGRIPVREKGNGMLPQAADSSKWKQYIPWDSMPQQFNPESGFIVNANNQVVDKSYPYLISNEWANPARANRISYLLSKTRDAGMKVDVAYTATIQDDTLDTNAVHLMKTVKGILGEDKETKEFRELFSWNGDMSENSYAPALYVSFVRNLKNNIYSDEIKHFRLEHLSSEYLTEIIDSIDISTIEKTLKDNQFWCDNVETGIHEDCRYEIKDSFKKAQAELMKLAGASKNDWRWVDISKRLYRHTPFSDVNVIRRLFERNGRAGGTPDTVNVAGYYFDESKGYVQFHGPGFRQIIELDKPMRQYIINSTGQSGNFFSKNYDDMIPNMNKNLPYELTSSKVVSQTSLLPEVQRQLPIH